MAFSSCKKDPCEDVNCLNGGVCDDGTCICPDGYSGPRCESFDPCFGVVCLNGGTCVNGICDCLTGYTGPDCGQQVTPSRIRISKIEVTRFPATDNNGAGWDLTSGPDIYVEFLKGSIELWSSPTYYQNATTNNKYDFNPSPSIDINAPLDQYTIRLYDYDDFDADDFMGGIIFTPYNNSNGFPTVINLDAGGAVAFRITVNYLF